MYKREDLEQMSDADLKALLKQRQFDSSKANVMQLGLKVTLNSAYGMIGNEHSRYYDIRIAEGITVSGQLSIQWIQRKLNEFLNKYIGTDDYDYCVAGDTDSIYLTLAPFVNKITKGKDVPKQKIVKMLDEFCEKVMQPVIDRSYNELKEYMNAYQQKMVMAREVIADRGIWRAKKNYALNVYNSEGVAFTEPKLKIMGMESVRSSTPEMCREAFKETIKIIMTKEESDVQAYIKSFRDTFMKAPIEDISFPRGISDIKKWWQPEGYKDKTPFHVKGAMSYNRMLRKAGVEKKYRDIRNGDKIKVIYLKKANPTHTNTIAYPDILPPEFGLDKYIDRVLQYEKSFLAPIESVLHIIGWQAEKKASLEAFF